MRMEPAPTRSEIQVRSAVESDIPALLLLMRGLAEFEGYADRFAVTEEVLREQGFRRSPPDFHCFVAERVTNPLAGMLVYYFIPFTFSARPTLYIKELFVIPESRSSGTGARLMRAAAREAVARGCALVKWQVADWNHPGIRFYQRLGARPSAEWTEFSLGAEEIGELATEPPS